MQNFEQQLTSFRPHNISAIFGDHYSSCLWHVINNGNNLEVEAAKVPIILSRGTPARSIPSELLHALVSIKCLLTIVSFSLSDANKKYFIDMVRPGGTFAIIETIRPQTYVIFASVAQISWLDSELLSSLDLRHWPEIFTLRTYSRMLETKGTNYKIRFLCWNCRRENNARIGSWKMALDVVESTCSTDQQQHKHCGKALKDIVAVFDEGAHFWIWLPSHLGYVLRPLDPFSRDHQIESKIKDAVAAFLYGINDSFTTSAHPSLFHPYFRTEVSDAIKTRPGLKQSVQYVGTTPAIKFITLDAVSDDQSSYQVYVTPFEAFVWYALVTSVCISCIVEIFFLRGLSWSYFRHIICSKVSSFTGLFVNSMPLQLSGQPPGKRLEQRSSKGILIVTAVWSIGGTFLLGSYGAAFSAECLRAFPYRTSYEGFMDLENFTLYYLLNDNQCTKYLRPQTLNSTMGNACVEGSKYLAECEIYNYIESSMLDFHIRTLEIRRSSADTTGLKSEVERHLRVLGSFFVHGFPLCNSVKRVEEQVEVILRAGRKAAFVTYGYEFQHNWEVFREVMKLHPDWKIANNFYSGDQFGVRKEAYVFTSGLKRRYQDRFEGRLKALVSSGIYELWVRWNRIKFSMSGLRHDEQKLSSFNGSPGDPVSFKNSALLWLFWSQCVAWLGTLVVFSFELICAGN